MKQRIYLFLTMALLLAMAVVSTVYAADNAALRSYYAGDVNGDWTVDTNDVRVIFLAVSGASGDVGVSLASDVDQDGTINTMDALKALRSTVAGTTPILVKPAFTEIDAAPDGDAIEFTRIGDCYSYTDDASRHVEDMWVAQSMEELQAIYADSKCVNDFTAEYDEAFFEDNAVILFAFSTMVEGFQGAEIDRIVKDGSTLCIVPQVELFMELPFIHFERFLLNVPKADLAGVDTLTVCTEYVYR